MWNKLTKKQISLIPKIGSQEKEKDPKVYAKFFLGNWTWYVTEMENDDMFGFVISPFAPNGEYGYISYRELLSLKMQGWLEADREIHQVNPREPKRLSVLLKEDRIR